MKGEKSISIDGLNKECARCKKQTTCVLRDKNFIFQKGLSDWLCLECNEIFKDKFMEFRDEFKKNK